MPDAPSPAIACIPTGPASYKEASASPVIPAPASCAPSTLVRFAFAISARRPAKIPDERSPDDTHGLPDMMSLIERVSPSRIVPARLSAVERTPSRDALIASRFAAAASDAALSAFNPRPPCARLPLRRFTVPPLAKNSMSSMPSEMYSPTVPPSAYLPALIAFSRERCRSACPLRLEITSSPGASIVSTLSP